MTFPDTPSISLECLEWFRSRPEYSNGEMSVSSCIPVQGERPVLGNLPNPNRAFAEHVMSRSVAQFDHGRGEWASLPPDERCETLATVIRDVFHEYGPLAAEVLMWEIGKSAADAHSEITRTADFLLQACERGAVLLKPTEAALIEGRMVQKILRPIGPVMCFGPANYPINESLTTALGAAAAGNPVILKLPRFGALALMVLAEQIQARLPEGVFQVLPGDGPTVVPPIMSSPNLRGLFFIGATGTLSRITESTPDPWKLKRVLGLGAKNPLYIHESADLEATLGPCVKAALGFNGQRCTAGKIILVDSAIRGEVEQSLAERVRALPLGMPWEAGVAITPLYDPRSASYFDELVADAKEKGARVLVQGGYDSSTGIYSPVVLGDVTPSMRLFYEEQFGPIIPIAEVTGPEDVVRYCIESPFGQQVSLFCGDANGPVAHCADPLLGSHLQQVNVNEIPKRLDSMPFGAVKDSGLNVVDIDSSVEAFTVPSLITSAAR